MNATLLDAMRAAGLAPAKELAPAGAGVLQRYRVVGDKAGSVNGWVSLRDEAAPTFAVFGSWKTGAQHVWRDGGNQRQPTADEQAAMQRRMAAAKAARDAEEVRVHAEARAKAERLWNRAHMADSRHPYLMRKGQIPGYGLHQLNGMLVVPARDTEGTLHTLQFISADGSKRFLSGGRIKGCFHLIGSVETHSTVLVCEGFATGATLLACTDHPVAVCFSANNLQPVAVALRAKYPDARMVVCADRDSTGIKAAHATAAAIGGTVVVPPKCSDKDTDVDGFDFNDLANAHGPDVVVQAIKAAPTVPAVPMVGDTFPLLSLDDGVVADEWPEPVPLPDALPPVAAFDVELLPEALRGWVADIAHRMQCPPDFTAVGAVTALSSLIGARAVVKPKERDDWAVVPNLWGLIVGRPGVMKSPALGETLKTMHRMEAQERELYESVLEEWELDNRVEALASEEREKQAKKLATKDPAAARELLRAAQSAPQPVERRYIINDATVEKLGEVLTGNPWGLLAYRDELHGLLCSLDKQGQEGSRAFYLQAYDGDKGYTFDRIIRGTTRVPRVCLSMLGGIQPGKLQAYIRDAVSGGGSDDGLLQRFGLAVWPDVAREFQYVDQWPDTPAKQAAWEVFERLNTLQPTSDNEPQEWRFSPDAQAVYVEWVTAFENEIRGDELHPALVSHLAKYRKLIPALALIFALVDTPESGHLIHETELLRALAWGDYLRSHAERIYSAAVIPETSGATTLLAKIKAGHLGNAFTPRQVAVKHWAGLGTPDAVRKAADLLVDYGWLAHETAQAGIKGGRPSDRYMVHPMLLGGTSV